MKRKYTFMRWDPVSLPLIAFDCGNKFPAFSTWKTRLDKTLIGMIWAEFDKGAQPEAFSNMILEFYAR